MTSLLLTIIFSTLLNIVFRLTKDKNVNNLYLITINYITCAIIAFATVSFPENMSFADGKISHGIGMGILFVLGFQILGLTIKSYGISFATVIQKVSLLIPVLVAFIVYDSVFSGLKFIGIMLALLAIFMMQKEIKISRDNAGKYSIYIFLLPILCFVVSGIVDSGFLVMAERGLARTPEEIQILTGVIFTTAAFVGLIISIIIVLKSRLAPSRNDLIYGIILGIPNFFSVRFLYEAVYQISGAVVFPIFNSGIIVLATIAGYFVFKEKLNKMTILGIVIACISIVILSMEA